MANRSDANLARLQQIMTELLKRRIRDSLEDVGEALSQWRSGDLGEFETHAAVLKHAARAERLAGRLARVGFDTAGALMRDAFDLELVSAEEFEDLMGCKPSEIAPSGPADEVEAARDLPPKRQVVDELLNEGAILVHLDARGDDVGVPEQFSGDPKLVLRFGFNLTPAIPDLHVDETGLSGTLTFGGVPHFCQLPWTAVYAVVSEANSRGLVWPDDVPDEVVGELAGAAREEEPAEPTPPPPDKKGRPHLRLVK